MLLLLPEWETWWFVPLAIMALMILLCIFMCRRMGCFSMCRPHDQPPAGKTGEPPLDILKHRYASGELTRDQFEQMKKDILD